MRTPESLDLAAAQVRAVRDWAHARTPIERAWIFGSRAKGTARPDSDVDVAIEVTPEPGLTAKQTMERGLVWLEWESDLEDAVGIRVDMLLHDGDRTPRTQAGVRDAGVIVYDRAERAQADAEMAELYNLHAEIEAAPLREDRDG